MPNGSNWVTSTVTGSVVSAYWARAIVDTFGSITTQPQGTRTWYENGQWWTWVEQLNTDDRQLYDLYLGGPTDLVEAHQVFTGLAGVTTADDASLELGSSYSLGVEARLDFGASGQLCVACKTGAFTIQVTGAGLAPAVAIELKGGGTTTLTIPATGTATGKHIIITAADGTAAVTWVAASGGTGNMKNYPPQTITDTANGLTWASNGGIDYFDWVRLDTSTANVFDVDLSQADFALGTLVNTESYTDGLGLSAN